MKLLRSRAVLARILLPAVGIVIAGCDLVLYDPEVVEGARRSEELTETASAEVTGWNYEDGSGRIVTPMGWYPDRLDGSSGYIIAAAPDQPELAVARVDDGAVIADTVIGLDGSQTPDRWDAWPVLIDATVREQYEAANPEADPVTPTLIVARFVENSATGTEARVTGITAGAGGSDLFVREDLGADLEGAIQSLTGAVNPPELISVQLAGYGPGGTLADGSTTDTAGVVLQVLARNRDTGQAAPFVFISDGIGVAEWVVSGAAAVPEAIRAGGSFVIPEDSAGERPGLIRHATLVDGGPGTVVSFRDGRYDSAPWRSFAVGPGGSTDEISSPFGISSVTIEGLLRTARSGSIGELSLSALPDVSLTTASWGTLWYAGTYPTQAGNPGATGEFEDHAAVELFTHVGIAQTITGDSVLHVAGYRD